MPGVCFAQRPQMPSSQETMLLLPVATLSVETRERSEQKGTSQGKQRAQGFLQTCAVEREP